MTATLSHGKSRLLTRSQLAKIPTPKRTATYQPVSFLSLVQLLEAELNSRGIKITNEQFSVPPRSPKLFGVMDLSLNGIPGGCAALGFRTSHDRSLMVKIVAGARVMVCDNLIMSGDFVELHRRHSTGLDLPGEVKAAVDRYQEHYAVLKDRTIKLEKHPCDNAEAENFMLRAFCDDRLMPIILLPAVRCEWYRPSHPDFEPRTWWSLLNAFTEVAKRLPLGVRTRVGQDLGRKLLTA